MSETSGIALMPQRTVMDELARRARGHCEVGIDGTIHASREWFESYTALVAEHCASIVIEQGGVTMFASDANAVAGIVRAAFPMPPTPNVTVGKFDASQLTVGEITDAGVRAAFGANQSIDDPATADEKNRRMRALLDQLPMPKG